MESNFGGLKKFSTYDKVALGHSAYVNQMGPVGMWGPCPGLTRNRCDARNFSMCMCPAPLGGVASSQFPFGNTCISPPSLAEKGVGKGLSWPGDGREPAGKFGSLVLC